MSAAMAEVAIVRERLYLHPGHSVIAVKPTIVTTILGSCVSVCLWDEVLGVGGLTHYLLPEPLSAKAAAARFGSTAIRELADDLRSRGANLTAKVFGGASMNSALATTGRDLGTRNVAVAEEIVRALNIPIAATDTGGTVGRKLIFQTDDGSAWVKYLEKR